MVRTNINTFIAIAKATRQPVNKPFFAKDIGLTSGQVQALKYHCYAITPTGRTRSEFIPIGGNTFRQVQAKEWVITPADKRSLNKWAEDLAPLVPSITFALKALGF
jgi:hypothetical protein